MKQKTDVFNIYMRHLNVKRIFASTNVTASKSTPKTRVKFKGKSIVGHRIILFAEFKCFCVNEWFFVCHQQMCWELVRLDSIWHTCMCLPACLPFYLLETYAKSTKFSFNDNNRISLLDPSMTFSSGRQPTFPLLILSQLSTLGRKLLFNRLS